MIAVSIRSEDGVRDGASEPARSRSPGRSGGRPSRHRHAGGYGTGQERCGVPRALGHVGVLGLGGDYAVLARLRPIVATRRRLLAASGPALVAAGFPLLPSLDHPHWTVVLSEPSPGQFARVRALFEGPIDNPAWTRPT